MPSVLITGANGFVGRAVCKRMIADGWRVKGTVRSQGSNNTLMPGIRAIIIDTIGPNTDWSEALNDVDVVIHLAARVHVMDETAADPLSLFRLVNTAGTVRLAQAAADSGVRRFVYVSTIKVNGEFTEYKSFTDEDQPLPVDPYAISKWEAEKGLHEISNRTELEVVILRPPLIYGPEVKGNFLRLLKWIDYGHPLPLGRVRNQRSLIGIDNFVDALIRCASDSRVVGQTFLLSDGEDLSTSDLIRRIASTLGKQANLIPLPVSLLYTVATIFGQKESVRRLCDSLQVDSSKLRSILSWAPPFTVTEELTRTAAWYKQKRKEKIAEIRR